MVMERVLSGSSEAKRSRYRFSAGASRLSRRMYGFAPEERSKETDASSCTVLPALYAAAGEDSFGKKKDSKVR